MINTLISAGASLLGGAFNGKMNKKAAKEYNKGQKEIAQMNNEWNAAEAAKNRDWQAAQTAKQNQWNLDQWNRENEYNSASSQRARLEEAGLNPYMMMDGGSAGQAGSISSAQPGSGAQAQGSMPNQVPAPFQMDFSGIANAINSHFVNKKLASETVGQDVNNALDMQFGPDFRKAQTAGLVNGKLEFLSDDYRRYRLSQSEPLAQLGVSKEFQEYRNLKASTELSFAQASQTYMNAEAQRLANKYIDQQNQADLAVKASQVFTNYSSGNLSLESAKTQIAQQALIAAQTSGQKISNKQARELSDAYVNAMREEYYSNYGYYQGLKRYSHAIGNSEGRFRYYEALNQAKDRDADLSEPKWIRHLRRGLGRTAQSFFGK